MIKEIMTRVKSETPSFFRKLIALGLILGSAGGAIIMLPTVFPTLVLPPAVLTFGGYMAAIGYVTAAISKLTVSDASVLNKDNAVTPQ